MRLYERTIYQTLRIGNFWMIMPRINTYSFGIFYVQGRVSRIYFTLPTS
jgi:hypothetical protein